jgi:uncharacterized protein YjbI with pentapeptide repeats
MRGRLARLAATGIVVAASVVAAFTLLPATPAGAATSVSCPTVSSDGTVSPAPSPGVDWAGCDLNIASMPSADLVGADLQGASMQSVYMPAANLSGADLSGADLTYAGLGSVNLTNASLSDANLTHAYLQEANLGSASLADANLTDANLDSTDLASTVLSDTTLTGVVSNGKLTGTPASLPAGWQLVAGCLAGPGADLARVILTGADLSGVDLSGADLSSDVLTDANLTGTDLANASLQYVQSGGIIGTPTLPSDWTLTGGFLIGPYVNLSDANLSGLDLTGDDLQFATLTEASLDGTDLTNATLSGVTSGEITGTAVLPANWQLYDGYLIGPGADLYIAQLAGIDLADADLAGASFIDANLTGANLSGADLAGATMGEIGLDNADLDGANLSGALLGEAQMTGASVAGADFSGDGFEEVTAGDVTGTPAEMPSGWLLLDGYFVGPSADDAGADLAGDDLAGDDLAGTDFEGANLTGADLAGADLAQAFLGNLTDANLTGADLNGATPSNLTDADLQDANLSFAQLHGVTFTGTNLTGADLTAVQNYSAGTGTPASLPADWSYADGYLLGPYASALGATLSGADLKGADLLSVDLQYANLTDADLADTSFDGTYLYQATLTGADVAGATWSGATCPNGDSSNKYLDGCLSPLDTTPPSVTVTGVRTGARYLLDAVPTAGCKTTDNGTVATLASLKLTTSGKNGVGRFTATCSGAVDLAGNKQQAPVSASYTVVYGFGGFTQPRAGSSVPRSAPVTVRFRLTNANGTPVAGSIAAALARAGLVRVTLRGPGISPVAARCSWQSPARYFRCTVRHGAVRTGRSVRYTLTVTENVGAGFLTAPAIRGASDPEVIHFR